MPCALLRHQSLALWRNAAAEHSQRRIVQYSRKLLEEEAARKSDTEHPFLYGRDSLTDGQRGDHNDLKRLCKWGLFHWSIHSPSRSGKCSGSGAAPTSDVDLHRRGVETDVYICGGEKENLWCTGMTPSGTRKNLEVGGIPRCLRWWRRRAGGRHAYWNLCL
jgi:hypothetical protein